ncbi:MULTISPECIES: Rho termination factor N-terminal domain-containing protein [Micromonospora]|uniref:Rho termination factor N-terminal domain-containing protein n=1 Tax=Micromonospora sicca TaxID=2202420 RepID=A0A317DKZ0_9ACTN|nr:MULTISPECIES: Rho termination factor N-terminal domain-containing protein [unclassified Micromonospora]MBM0225268.1 hypothetical protein [Micromonospora sp. ATA51]PWR15268.1 hypothetical protein DKT69_11980 [Micromonospora sp. 4G51]
MTDPTRTALARVAEFLTGLSAADLTELAAGRARLALVRAGDATPSGPSASPALATAAGTTTVAAPTGAAAPLATRPVAASAVDPEHAYAALAAMSRRDDGTAYLSSWTTRDLRALAARTGLRGVTGLRKMELVERIVDRTIGFRLDSTAIRRR